MTQKLLNLIIAEFGGTVEYRHRVASPSDGVFKQVANILNIRGNNVSTWATEETIRF